MTVGRRGKLALRSTWERLLPAEPRAKTVQDHIDELPMWVDGTLLSAPPMTRMQWLIWSLAAAGKFFTGFILFMTGVLGKMKNPGRADQGFKDGRRGVGGRGNTFHPVTLMAVSLLAPPHSIATFFSWATVLSATATWAEIVPTLLVTLDAMLPAGLVYSLFVHAHGLMEFCDRLHCLIRHFYFCE
jgi:hypothetical protein